MCSYLFLAYEEGDDARNASTDAGSGRTNGEDRASWGPEDCPRRHDCATSQSSRNQSKGRGIQNLLTHQTARIACIHRVAGGVRVRIGFLATGVELRETTKARVVVPSSWLGVAYLLYLAWRTLRDKSMIDVDADTTPKSFGRVIRTAILINLLNPKLTIFFFAFLPQFVPAGAANGTWRMIGLSLVFMVLTFVVFALYGIFAAAMRNQVITRPKVMAWLRRTFAGTYVLLAGRLALETR